MTAIAIIKILITKKSYELIGRICDRELDTLNTNKNVQMCKITYIVETILKNNKKT